MLESKYCNNFCTVRASLNRCEHIHQSIKTEITFDKDDGLDQQELIIEPNRVIYPWSEEV